jgi:hypothetical protein
MRRMRWFKVAAIGVGILIAFLIVGSVIGAILHAVIDVVIAAAVVGAVVVAVKVARSRKQVSGSKKADREVREPGYEEYSRPLPRADTVSTRNVPTREAPVRDVPVQSAPSHDVEDELARLKREMGSLSASARRLALPGGELGHRGLGAVPGQLDADRDLAEHEPREPQPAPEHVRFAAAQFPRLPARRPAPGRSCRAARTARGVHRGSSSPPDPRRRCYAVCSPDEGDERCLTLPSRHG